MTTTAMRTTTKKRTGEVLEKGALNGRNHAPTDPSLIALPLVAAETSLLGSLGQDDREGLPRRSARLLALWPAHEHSCLRERSALHHQNPRTPRLSLIAAVQAPAPPRDPPRRRN